MSLTVVGGIYVEKCVCPADDVIFGSGGRAAATLKSLDADVSLVSFVGNDAKAAIEYEAEFSWRIPLQQYEIAETVSFEYYHGLAVPIIRPPTLPFVDAPQIQVSADAILQFGMLESDAIVHGEYVVFDPQNPSSPHTFSEHGSTADHLAYVLNAQEARALAGESDSLVAAKRLLSDDGAEVVVVKSGARGAQVVTGESVEIVPAFETPRTWPIGSGDVFAAVFAHYWATGRLDPVAATRYASRAAALYCSTREVPVNVDRLTARIFEYPEIEPTRYSHDATIYLAGPFFTMGQLWLVDEARQALQAAGFKVFSPFHDVGVGDAEEVVPQDVAAIEIADAMLALCDGLDSGTLFEVGYAVKKGLPVVAFAEQTSDEAMKMLVGTNCKVLRDLTSAIYQVQWEALR